MNYPEAIDWLFARQLFGIKLGLDATHHLLKDCSAYPASSMTVIHVAGTNGKGSTCAMIDSIVRASGQSCGLFTSPHLIDFRERIKVGGDEISEEFCAAMLTDLQVICERMETSPTFFEITLVLAMRWFIHCECQVIVLETGMGGRLDATTAVPADVCVITPIGIDHTPWLGNTLEEIAFEKAGIFVSGKPAISAPQKSEINDVLRKIAAEKKVPLSFIDQPLLDYPISLMGEHQQWNAALAVAALNSSGLTFTREHVRQGLSQISWPGRFEIIQPGVILDGAHNPQSAEILAATWQQTFPAQQAALIFSAVDGKDIPGILEFLAPLASRIFFCPVNSARAITAHELSKSLPANSPPYEIFDTFQKAFAAAATQQNPILIAGSLFLIGEARAFLTDRKFQSSSQ